MFLKDFTGKEIIVGKTSKGICRGVGISLKTHDVKYLLCASLSSGNADFCISASSVQMVGEQIALSHLRPLCPKNCAKVFVGSPVYSFDGVYLGKIRDLAMQGFTATRLFTDRNTVYPITAVTASQDAILLKRGQPFPLGQRIPAPLLSHFGDKKDGVITKPVLRSAIGQGRLIRLTLALSPFAKVD